MSPVLCALPGCAIRNRHVSDCADWDACWGCLPARADDGLILCQRDTGRIGESATRDARVYDDLGKVLIRRGRGGEVRASSTGAPIPDEDVTAARADIRDTLLRVARWIAAQRGVSMPEARVVMGATVARTRYDGSAVVDRDGNAVTYTSVRPSTPLETVAQFISLHARWIAAQPDAGKIAWELRELARPGSDAWRLAYPSATSRLYIGECPLIVTDLNGEESVCGTRLRWDGDAPLIRCEGCETDETIEQWQRWIVGEHGGHVDNLAAAADLSLRWSRVVDPSLLRKWAERARRTGRELMVLEPDPTDPEGMRTRPVRDGRRRVLYDLAAVWEEARRIWGDQPTTERRVA